MMNNIEWEPVESPEYIAFCEANNYGYTAGVSKCGNWFIQKVWVSDDISNKEYNTFTMSTYNPFEERRTAPIPFRISSADGSYVDPIQKRNNFINSLPSSIMIPKGILGDDKSDMPIFRTEYSMPFDIAPKYQVKLPEPVYTDWDKECESLKDWLKYKILHTHIRLRLDNIPYKSPSEIMDWYKKTGLLIVSEFDLFREFEDKCMSFEDWKKENKINNCLLL